MHDDGSVSSKLAIRFLNSNVTFMAGTHFKPGALLDGLDITQMTEHDIKGTIHEEHGEEVFVISKFYK